MSIDPAYYREVLSFFPTGVTVVTGIDGERPIGFTIGSFTSVSLDPPLVGFLPMITSDRWADIHRTGQIVGQYDHREPIMCHPTTFPVLSGLLPETLPGAGGPAAPRRPRSSLRPDLACGSSRIPG